MKLFIFIIFIIGSVNTQSLSISADTAIVTFHSTLIRNKKVEYTATTGTQPVWNDKGISVAAVHYTYYERQYVKDQSNRPILISFNGGPGSGSVWMHLAYTGPMILKVDDEGFPVQPYGVKKNPYSILDVADIVFVNPVNTGYSRIIDKDVKKEITNAIRFYGNCGYSNYLKKLT